MYWIKKIILILSLFFLVISLNKCSKDEIPVNPIVDHTDATYHRIMDLQNNLYKKFSTLVLTVDTSKALDSLLKYFLADTSVKFGQKGNQGIAVEYNNGIKGGVFINGNDEPFQISNMKKSYNNSFENLRKQNYTSPNSSQTIILNPHFYERSYYTNRIVSYYNLYFPKVDLNNPVLFTNTDASIEKFTSLSDYGYVHIYSHGWAWPNETSISEVYLMTGSAVSTETTSKYWEYLKSGDVLITYVGQTGKNQYFISPKFFADHNNFSNKNTLVYGGFCYSFLGTWPQKLLVSSHASNYLGFDWSVYTNKNSDWSYFMAFALSDTSLANPKTIEGWFTDTSDISKKYWNAQHHRYVHINYTGASDYTLWTRVKIDSISPNAGNFGTIINIYGKGFGSTQGSSAVLFGSLSASVSSWSDTRITATVPTGAVTGNVFVNVNGKKSNGVLFTIGGPQITSVIPDSGFIGATIKINGNNFGTNQSIVKVFLGSIQATNIISLSNTSIDVKVPEGAVSGNLYVQVNSVNSNTKYFKVIPIVPVLNNIKPFSALPGNRIELYGIWPAEYSPENSYIKIDGVNYQPTTSSSWYNGKLYLDIPSSLNPGQKQISVVYKGIESNKINYLIGIPVDSIRSVANKLKSDYHINVEVRRPDQTTFEIKINASSYTAEFFDVVWNGLNFSATYIDGSSTSIFTGTISSDGTKITALNIDYKNSVSSDHVIFNLKQNESIQLEAYYAANYAIRLLQGNNFSAPYYLIKEADVANKFTASGNYGTGTVTKVLGYASSGGYNSIIPMLFD